MDSRNNIATDLFYKIRSRFSGLKLGSEIGEITINPEEARFFDFDYMEDEVPVGHVSVSLAEPGSMKIYFSHGITETMDTGQKRNWYKFLRELRQFAKRRLLAFDTRDIAKDNLDKRDYAFLSQHAKKQQTPTTMQSPVGESVMNESTMYGSKTLSYQKLMDTRLIIKHSHAVMDDTQPGARTRNISALFVENQDGERFKYPFIHLAGARAMQRHVANGGLPYDQIGESIIKMSEEIAQLKNFGNYVVRNDLMNSQTNSIVERSTGYLNQLKETIYKLSKQKHYESYKENFQAAGQVELPEEVVEDFVEKFTVKNFKEDIKSVFPVLYRLMQENDSLGYNDVVAMTQEEVTNEDVEIDETEDYADPFDKFESWIMAIGEQSAIDSEDPEEQSKAIQDLQQLVGEAFPVGVDGTNAIESLKGIIEDPELFQSIKELSKQNSEEDARPAIFQWLEMKAPEVIDQLDFGDMPQAQPQEQPQAQPQEQPQAQPQPQEGIEMNDYDDDYDDDNDGAKKSDVPAALRKAKGGKDWKLSTKDLDKEKERNISSSDWLKKHQSEDYTVEDLAEFIKSFYDRDSGTFPKGPEGVATMVGKKFGERAEQVARMMVERLAPEQSTENNPELQELARIKGLAGVQKEDDNVVNAPSISEEDDESDKTEAIQAWADKYSQYQGANGDPLPQGWLQYQLNTGVPSDAFEDSEYDEMLAKYDAEEIETNPEIMDEMPITKAMFDDLEQIFGGPAGEDEAELVNKVIGKFESASPELSRMQQLAGVQNEADNEGKVARHEREMLDPKKFDTFFDEYPNPKYSPEGTTDELDPNYEPEWISVGVDFDYDYEGEETPATEFDPGDGPEIKFEVMRVVDLETGEDITDQIDEDEMIRMLEDNVDNLRIPDYREWKSDQDYARGEDDRKNEEASDPELSRIKHLSGITKGLGL